MSWVAVGVGVAGSIGGGLLGSSSAKKAASAQKHAAAMAQGTQQQAMFQARSDLSPYLGMGKSATSTLADLMGFEDPTNPKPTMAAIEDELLLRHSKYYGRTPDAVGIRGIKEEARRRYARRLAEWEQERAEKAAQPQSAQHGALLRDFTAEDLEADPVYQSGLQFGLNTGLGAINKRAASMGAYDSGATLKALTRYGNDYGSMKANESFNRFNLNKQNKFAMLSGLAGSGQNAAGTAAGIGMAGASNVANIQSQMGDANAMSSLLQGNSWQNALSGAANAMGNYFSQRGAASTKPAYSGTGYTNGDVWGLQNYQGLY